MARPSKYTKELVGQIVGYIAEGLTTRDTCYGARISEDTFLAMESRETYGG